MNNKIALIVTAENKLDLSYYNDDKFFVVGVERGCLDLIEKNIKLDLAICDFDHVLDNELEFIQTKANKTVQLDTHKDYLDGFEAVQYVKKMGIDKIKYICEPSRRMDMNLSFVELMKKFDDVEIYNEKSFVRKLKAGTNSLDFNSFQDYAIMSLFTLENDNHITIKNTQYDTDKLVLNVFDTTAFSNAFRPYQNPEFTNSKDMIVILTK